MNLYIYQAFLIISINTFIAVTNPVDAANPEQVKQLLSTRKCPNCDLSKANLASGIAHINTTNYVGLREIKLTNL